MTDFYRIEEAAGSQADCQCDNCKLWTVVHTEPDGEEMEIGTSWQGPSGMELADDVCGLMNMAYEAGRESAPSAQGEKP